ncbi:MAG: FABP family protein [Rhodospirillales bacterium]|nr:FABP family protein [Rhodospirillales bacterium]
MSDTSEVDYGPLKHLVGSWEGDNGVDIAPEPDGEENNPYFETITFSEIGDVTNAESQILSALFYRQIVKRKSNDEVFHDQTGYWMWDAQTNTVMHSLAIPRAVCVIAGGIYSGEHDEDGRAILELSAALDDPKWKIIQSPFMQENASSKAFKQKIVVGNGRLTYSQTTTLDIYGRIFEHTDNNELTAS